MERTSRFDSNGSHHLTAEVGLAHVVQGGRGGHRHPCCLAELADAANDAAEKFGAFTQADLRQRGGNHDRLFDAFDLNSAVGAIAGLRGAEAIWEGEENADLREEAQALMTILDVDHDGTIGTDEFAGLGLLSRHRRLRLAESAAPSARRVGFGGRGTSHRRGRFGDRCGRHGGTNR